MKKYLLCLISVLTFTIFASKVSADSFSATLTSSDSFTDEITIKLQISNYQDNNSTCQGICAFSADYNYDTSKIELIKVTSLNDFRLLQGNGNVVLSKATGVSSGSEIVAFTFKNKGLSNNEEVTFTMTNLNASNGDDDITGNNVSKTFKYISKTSNDNQNNNNNNNNNQNNNNNNNNNNQNNNNNNKNQNNTTTGSNTNNNDKKNDTKPEDEKSSNADLKSITISSGDIKFSKDILNYNVVVDNKTSSITITVKTDDENAKVIGTGKHSLNVGDNKIEIIVTAEDGTKKTYTINISRDKALEPAVKQDNVEVNDNSNSLNKTYLIIILIIIIVILLGIIVYMLKKKRNN